MIILAFDTCLGAVSAAVSIDGRITGRFELCPIGHAERLMPVIEAAIADAGVAFTDVQRIAVTLGPGGFTGLRVGISAARAFSLAMGVPVVGLSSLDVLARGVSETIEAPRIVVAAPAGRAGAYVQLFETRPFVAVAPARLLAADETAPDLADAIAVGPGATLLSGRVAGIDSAYGDAQPDAVHLARLARDLTPLDHVRPIYLRAADAKPQTGKGLARAVDSRQT
jgi:tRNA threonylcarbamoyladenosine biosynthesis protein TsaB